MKRFLPVLLLSVAFIAFAAVPVSPVVADCQCNQAQIVVRAPVRTVARRVLKAPVKVVRGVLRFVLRRG